MFFFSVALIHSSKDGESTDEPINKKMGKKNMVCLHSRLLFVYKEWSLVNGMGRTVVHIKWKTLGVISLVFSQF